MQLNERPHTFPKPDRNIPVPRANATIKHHVHQLVRDTLLHEDTLSGARLNRYHHDAERRIGVARDPVFTAMGKGEAQVTGPTVVTDRTTEQ